ncbi:MAG: phosphatase PAP2 family protein [Rhodobacteraceae bacterium]|nr:phosphatase PAP2 family protein [Paracoccaceae bacterium]
MLAGAMTLSAEGILGYWNGVLTPPFQGWPGGWTSFARLQGDARMAVLQHDLAPLFRVGASGAVAGAYEVTLSGLGPLLTLTPPTPVHLAAQMPHVRAAADLRADRLAEIMVQMGDMLSFYAAHFRLHPDARKWTLVFLGAVYEAILIPEMRLKFHCSLPRPYDFSSMVQPIIGTPSHSTYPSGHATEAFAFAAVLCGLRHLAAGAADPVSAVLADLAAYTGSSTPEMLPFLLAARIADNRTVAGVHFPVDSAHGALLGLTTGLAVLAACLGGPNGVPTKMPVWQADGANWASDFSLDGFVAALPGWNTGGSVTLPVAPAGSVLQTLLVEVMKEWT